MALPSSSTCSFVRKNDVMNYMRPPASLTLYNKPFGSNREGCLRMGFALKVMCATKWSTKVDWKLINYDTIAYILIRLG